MVRVGVDAGGTFTDVCLIDANDQLVVFKLPSSPRDPSEAIANGVTAILEQQGVPGSAVHYLGHGTTVATNALLEGHGGRTGIITTEGFRDLLEIGRQQRPDLYDLQADKPTPLVRRALRLEAPERVTSGGEVLRALDLTAAREAVRQLKQAGVEAIAVCFLFSYLRPDHEDVIGQIVAEEFPEAFLSLSHDVVSEFREYERLSTTVVNSYVGPLMSRYIHRLRDRFRAAGVGLQPHITQSNGGIISLETAAQSPVRTVLSGPAAGVVGGAAVAAAAGYRHIITFDMGGTSTDVSLVAEDGASIRMLQEVAGYPIRTPMIDINTVGAGGGSIAWIDSGGHLKVGPRSAGADPGPACYGRGGTQPTVTDAHAALGVISREALLGGHMPIDAAAADAAIRSLAAELHLEFEEVAQGVIDVVTANMVRAIRVISVERGHDPRDFTLVAFGGAGPLHAARLARELEAPRVLAPTIPGILCAYGLLVADARTDFTRTQVLPADAASLTAINACFDELLAQARSWFDREQILADNRHVRPVALMRYVRQNFELSIALPSHRLAATDLPLVLEAFHAAHEKAYGYSDPSEPVQWVTLRLEARGAVRKPEPRRLTSAGNVGDARLGSRRSFLPEAGGWCEVPLYARHRLGPEMVIEGPAIVEQMDSTTLILPAQQALVDAFGNLVVTEIR